MSTLKVPVIVSSEELGPALLMGPYTGTRSGDGTHDKTYKGATRSGMGAYAGAARRRVHLTSVLLRPPSGHRPGRRQARHARILQIGLHVTQL